ncbi:hypothetical protein [Butyrivibrio sp. AE2032]|uniref:hypothetical protein n=1 Tax=Butyrivibrio sp. AE2032 TaxID=1458463 RepID=UPI000557F978|nr:hypothetical protein [Butyrivibrio sp. AE2032]
MDNTLVYSIITTVSAIAFLVGTVLLIVSIVFTAKGKKTFVAGIICGALIVFCGMIFFVYGLFGQLIIGINTIVSNIPAVTEFTPAEGSRPISGTFKIDGDEVTLPCTVDDLTKLGYDTDYEYFDGCIMLWIFGSDNMHYDAPQFFVYLDRSYGYDSYAHTRGFDQVAAVKIRNDLGIGFELNDIAFGMTKEDFIAQYGTPAYEIDNSFYGDSLYYLGDNGVIYRLNFGSVDGSGNLVLVGVMVGTSEYMEREMTGLYHI